MDQKFCSITPPKRIEKKRGGFIIILLGIIYNDYSNYVGTFFEFI
jgi:hypothetical protein